MTKTRRSRLAVRPSGVITARAPRTKPRAAKKGMTPQGVDAVPVTMEELRALQQELQRRMSEQAANRGRRSGQKSAPHRRGAPARWNPEPDDVQKSVAQLVLTVVEFLRQLMERQAIRRMEANTLTPQEVEAVGSALMRLEETVHEIGARFGLAPEELNLDLGAITLM